MTSISKINANRANAQASTGPKTVQGRKRAARNARRHGLSLPLYSDPLFSRQVEGLVDEIVGTKADAKIRRFACPIAEAQLDLQRVWHARHQFLSEKLNEPYYESRTSRRAKVNLICRILGLNLPKNIMALLTKFITTTPQGEDKFALILSQEAQWLLRLDRYERRALSRRKFAIREFDAECREEKRNRL